MVLDLPPLADLAAAIHRAAEATAALSAPSPSSHVAAAVAALRDAHAAIGSFLSRLDAASASSGDDQPMADGGEEPEEEDGEQMIGEVEEGLRGCALQGRKRRKRAVPPSWPLGRRSSGACEARPPLRCWTWRGGGARPWIYCCSSMRRRKGPLAIWCADSEVLEDPSKPWRYKPKGMGLRAPCEQNNDHRLEHISAE